MCSTAKPHSKETFSWASRSAAEAAQPMVAHKPITVT